MQEPRLAYRPAIPGPATRRPLVGDPSIRHAARPQKWNDDPAVPPGQLEDRRQPHHGVRVADEDDHLSARRLSDAADLARSLRALPAGGAAVRQNVLRLPASEL